MVSYRPKIKQDKNGTVSDLALDAETVQGIDVVDRLKSVPLYVASVSGTAAVTTSGSYYHAKWNLTDVRVSALYDGLRVSFKIPVAGNGSYGTGISINSGDYHPVVFNVNSMVGTRYGVNSTMTLVYNSTQTGVLYINNTSTTITGVWQIEDYDSNTTTTYGTLSYYMRPYVGAHRLTAYKIVALDKDNRVIPITTEQYMGNYSGSTTYAKDDIVVSSSKYYKSLQNSNKGKGVSNTSYWTQITMPSQFTPNTTAFKPDKIYFYNTTAGIASGAVIGGQALTEIGYNTSVCAYTFWASITTYKMIYLQGTYNTTTGLFTLDTGANYYKLVPNNTANITLSSYFTSGKDYIFVGATYSSANYFQLAMVNTMYHFDGTNLVQYDTYRANTIVTSIPSPVTESTVSGWGFTKVTESTVSGWGFTKNTGTVTSVSAGTGLSISGTASTTPTVNVADGYKLQKTISTQDVRITDLQAGTYVLTYSGNIRLYWNGADSDDYVEHLYSWTNNWNPILVVQTTGTSWFWECYNFKRLGWNFKGKVTPEGNAYSWYDCQYFVWYTDPGTQLGSKTKPVYLETSISGGYSTYDQVYKHATATACDEYAGGTAVTLNGTSKAASTASFYAPTSALAVSTDKVYLIGASSTTSIETVKSNASCYMQNGKLYSNGTEVSVSGHTHSSLKNGNYTASLPTLTANATLALTSDIPTINYPVTDVKVNNSSVVSNKIASITAVTSINGSSGAITNVAKTDADNNFSVGQTVSGDVVLYSASGSSPMLQLKVGSLSDSSTDWGFINNGSQLNIKYYNPDPNITSWVTRVMITTTGVNILGTVDATNLGDQVTYSYSAAGGTLTITSK